MSSGRQIAPRHRESGRTAAGTSFMDSATRTPEGRPTPKINYPSIPPRCLSADLNAHMAEESTVFWSQSAPRRTSGDGRASSGCPPETDYLHSSRLRSKVCFFAFRSTFFEYVSAFTMPIATRGLSLRYFLGAQADTTRH